MPPCIKRITYNFAAYMCWHPARNLSQEIFLVGAHATGFEKICMDSWLGTDSQLGRRFFAWLQKSDAITKLLPLSRTGESTLRGHHSKIRRKIHGPTGPTGYPREWAGSPPKTMTGTDRESPKDCRPYADTRSPFMPKLPPLRQPSDGFRTASIITWWYTRTQPAPSPESNTSEPDRDNTWPGQCIGPYKETQRKDARRRSNGSRATQAPPATRR
jgi:hypothetical protein